MDKTLQPNTTITRNLLLFPLVFLAICTVYPTCANNREREGTTKQDSKIVDSETYCRVLDLLFPMHDSDQARTLFELVLRFEPSSSPESQIILRKRTSGVYGLRQSSGPSSIWNQLNSQINRGRAENAIELARSIPVEVKEISPSVSELEEWQSKFFSALGDTKQELKKRSDDVQKTLSEKVVLDGTTYELWYRQGMTEMHFKFYGVEINTSDAKGQLTLANWMNSVRMRIETTAD